MDKKSLIKELLARTYEENGLEKTFDFIAQAIVSGTVNTKLKNFAQQRRTEEEQAQIVDDADTLKRKTQRDKNIADYNKLGV